MDSDAVSASRNVARVSTRVGLSPQIAQAAFNAVRRHLTVDSDGRWCIEVDGAIVILDGLGCPTRVSPVSPYRRVPGRIATISSRVPSRSIAVEIVLDVWSRHACELAMYPCDRRGPWKTSRRGRRYDAVAFAAVDRLSLEMEQWALRDAVQRIPVPS